MFSEKYEIVPRVTRNRWKEQQQKEQIKKERDDSEQQAQSIPETKSVNHCTMVKPEPGFNSLERLLQSADTTTYRRESPQQNPIEIWGFFESLGLQMKNEESKKLFVECNEDLLNRDSP